MENPGVSGENRSIWGKTGVFRENLSTPVFPQIFLSSLDTPVVSIYSVFSKYSRFPPRYSCFPPDTPEYMETTGVSGENRSIWEKTGVFRENRVYGDNGSIWRKQKYLGENGSI
jgi:hypothetical protein